MKDAATKLKCFELRAQGKSLKAIAAMVGARRQTVANWLREHEEEVENLKAMELDALREACWMTTQARIEQLRTRLEQITTELDTRDFSEVPTAKLVELELKTRAELAREFADRSVRSEDELRKAKSQRTSLDNMVVWPDGDTSLLLDADERGNGQRQPRRAKHSGKT